MGTMDYRDEDLRFEFRDPYYSDEDFTQDDANTNAASASEFRESGDDEDSDFELWPWDSPDRSELEWANDGKSGATSNILGETSKSNLTFPYMQVSELEEILQAGMSLLGQSSCEGTSSGAGPSTSKAPDHDLDAIRNLGNHIEELLSRFVVLKEAVAAAEIGGDADSAVVEVPADQETWKASSSYSDGGGEMLPMRKRLVVAWNKRANPELAFGPREGGTPAESQVHYSEAGPSHETPKEQLERLGPTLKRLGTLARDISSSLKSSETLQTGMIESVKAGENTVSAESRMERVYGGPEETDALPRLRPETPDKDEEGTSSAAVTGRSDGRLKVGRVVLSRRERLHARLRNSTKNDGSYVCRKCGVQQNLQAKDGSCIICSDANRNFPPLDQVWMSHIEVVSFKDIVNDVENSFEILEPDLCYQIYTTAPAGFYQSQRAIFLKLPEGNILWDCLSYICEETVVEIAKMGGLKAIAISCPDRIGSCGRLSYIFNRCPIYIHVSDRGYLPTGKNGRESWDAQMKYLWDGVTIIHLGGHFPGSCILHLDRNGGIVFSSNALKVGADRNSVSVMLHYANCIPASAKDVKRILHIMQNLEFDRVWGDHPGEEILEHAKPRVISSLLRYIKWVLHDEDALEFQTQPLTKRELIARGKRKVHEL